MNARSTWAEIYDIYDSRMPTLEKINLNMLSSSSLTGKYVM